jgi:hypothetical protein
MYREFSPVIMTLIHLYPAFSFKRVLLSCLHLLYLQLDTQMNNVNIIIATLRNEDIL